MAGESTRRRKALRAVLFVGGGMFLFFGVLAFVSAQTLTNLFNIYGRLVGEEHSISGSPLAIYVLRLGLMAMGVLGVFLFRAAWDPVGQRAIVHLAIAIAAVYVIFAPIAGVMAGVSYRWFSLDAGMALVFLVLLIVLRR